MLLSLEGLQLGLLVPVFAKGYWEVWRKLSTTFAAVITARMVKTNKRTLGWIPGDGKHPFPTKCLQGGG